MAVGYRETDPRLHLLAMGNLVARIITLAILRLSGVRAFSRGDYARKNSTRPTGEVVRSEEVLIKSACTAVNSIYRSVPLEPARDDNFTGRFFFVACTRRVFSRSIQWTLITWRPCSRQCDEILWTRLDSRSGKLAGEIRVDNGEKKKSSRSPLCVLWKRIRFTAAWCAVN